MTYDERAMGERVRVQTHTASPTARSQTQQPISWNARCMDAAARSTPRALVRPSLRTS